MRRAAPLMLLALLLALPTIGTSGSTGSGYYPGLGALREGGRLLIFRQGLPGDPVEIIPIDWSGGKALVTASSDGTIAYMGSTSVIRTLSICSGRQVRMAHARTERGGVIYAICYSRERGASFATIMDGGGFKFFGIVEVSRRNSSGTGFIYSDYRTDFPTVMEPPAPLVADMDGDGYEEALVYIDKQLLYVDSPLSEPKAYPIQETPLGFSYGDPDGDGRREVVISSQSGVLTWTPEGGLRLYSSQPCSSSPILADFDGDGRQEVACYRGDTLQVLKGSSVLLRAEGGVTEPVAHDLNGDGRAELIYAMRDGTLVARSVAGILWRARVEAPYNRLAVADVDGDFRPEVLAACGQYLHCFSWDGREKWRISLREPSGWVSGGTSTFQTYMRFEAKTPPVPVDFDGDGLLEVIVGIGAYLEQGRIAMVDEISGAGEPPRIEVLQPSNHSKVGRYFNLSIRVSDDLSSVLRVRLSIYSGGWADVWSGEVRSGELIRRELPSSESVLIEASDGISTSKAILKLRVDTEPPKMLIEPGNMSKIGPGRNITVRVLAPIEEYAFLTILHGAGPGHQWVKLLERRVWKTSLVSLDVTPIIEGLSGYHYFKFILRDAYGNVEEVVMRYAISESKPSSKLSESECEGRILLEAPRIASSIARISWSLVNVRKASLYYGNGLDWKLIGEVEGNGSMDWNVSSLPDGEYMLKLESGDLRALAELRVDNTPPRIEVSVDREVLRVGEVARVRVSGDFERLYWDLDGDGLFETLGPAEAMIKGNSPGRIEIGVMAVDSANNTAKRRVSLTVEEERVEESSQPSVESSAPSVGPALGPELLMRPEVALPAAALVVVAMLKSRRGRRRGRSNPWR